MPQPQPYSTNLAHLQGALLGLNLRLHRQVLRWRAAQPEQAAPDELLGLYLSDQGVDVILDGLYTANAPADADAVDQAPIATLSALITETEAHHQDQEVRSLQQGVELRLVQLTDRCGLTPAEQQVILLTLAPELDRQYDRLFGYLNNDITRRQPSVALALELWSQTLAERVALRQVFAAEGRLRSLRLIRLSEEPASQPPGLLNRGLQLEERVVGYLLGTEDVDPALLGLLQGCDRALPFSILESVLGRDLEALCNYLRHSAAPAPIFSLTGADAGLLISTAIHLSACARAGSSGEAGSRYGSAHLPQGNRELKSWECPAPPSDSAPVQRSEVPLLLLDGALLSTHANPEDMVARGLREAHLCQAALALQNPQLLLTGGNATAALRRLLTAACPVPRFLLAPEPWAALDRGLSQVAAHVPLLTLTLPVSDIRVREQLWANSLNGQAIDLELTELADRFRLTSQQIQAAAQHAQIHAAAFSSGIPLSRMQLFAGCRAHSGHELAGLAQPIASIHTWQDLILPPGVKAQLQSLEHWVRHRPLVYETWGFSERMMLGRGLAVLFSGPSGTGKTMAAGIVARNLELDLYRIDLSSVVSKYIGETEKNLSRIFTAAEAANAILFFDEADALFGKRSEVKDAHDRYANIEVDYLLQRIESYDGVAILATNFRQNLDQAFARRLQVIVEFPFPQASDRERIWRQLLPATVPQSGEIDLGYLSRQFSFSGGNIKNCVLTAAFAAAAEDRVITMRHLIQAVVRELEKLGQPIVTSDFGLYRDLIRPPSPVPPPHSPP